MLRLGLAIGFAASSAAIGQEPRKPNVVLIVIDDLGYADIGPFGSQINRTPNLDRMANEGRKLTNFYAAPLCSASRAQLMTGCYAKRVGMPDVVFPVRGVGLNPTETPSPNCSSHRAMPP